MVRRKRWVVMAHALGLASLPGGCVLEPTIHPVETILLADVSTGFHSCALTLETTVFCWGSRAGDGTTLHRNTPTPVATPAGVTFHNVSAGGHFACALSDAAATYCWGSNNVGQLGDGSTTDRVAPVPVQTPAGISFSSVSAGMEHACAVAAGV